LITGILLLPLAPVRGVVWVSEQIRDEVNRQHHDPGVIARELREVDEKRKRGELSEEQAAAREQELIDRQIAAAGGSNAPARGNG
jgi:hypothetical protein